MKLCKRCVVIAFKAFRLCGLLILVRLLGVDAGTHVATSAAVLADRVRLARRVNN